MNKLSPSLSITTGPLPGSAKGHVETPSGLRVPFREVALHPTANEPPLRLYDTSGPYTDPALRVDIHAGLPRPRDAWLRGHADLEA
jgi:phosphomethylpyrimidine synthase